MSFFSKKKKQLEDATGIAIPDVPPEVAEANKRLIAESKKAFVQAKKMLRGSHVANQYVSLAAGGLVCASTVICFLQILATTFDIFGMITQAYLCAFGLAVIGLEVPIVEHTRAVMAFRLGVDKWLKVLMRRTARGVVYFTQAVLIIDTQVHYTKFGEYCGFALFIAGLFSIIVGLLTTYDMFQLKVKLRQQTASDGSMLSAEQTFDSADADKNGHLTKDEVFQMVKRLHPNMTDLQIEALFISLDDNKDNKISKEEFLLWYNLELEVDDFA